MAVEELEELGPQGEGSTGDQVDAGRKRAGERTTHSSIEAAAGQSALADGGLQEQPLPFPGLEQGDVEGGTGGGENQTREPGTAADVDQPAVAGADQVQARQRFAVMPVQDFAGGPRPHQGDPGIPPPELEIVAVEDRAEGIEIQRRTAVPRQARISNGFRQLLAEPGLGEGGEAAIMFHVKHRPADRPPAGSGPAS